MSQENVFRINTSLLIFALSSLVTVAVTWGTVITGQRQMQETLQRIESEARSDHSKVITHEEKIYGLERRVSAVERKTGIAGQSAGDPEFVDGRKP